MRDLKFRLRDQKNKIVGYEKWYEGVLTDDGHWTAKPQWLYSVNGKYWNPEYIEHRYKDQYTSLKDKNGKEIYKCDLVSGKGPYFSTTGSEVFFNYDGAYIIIGDNKILISRFNEIEIIGNTFEHSKLLAVEREEKDE